ncbi:hypothetical protein GCM10010174_81090 [Kutzneria viridogrisea]|uniref:Uncharacterized protein n=1 Tax=Kutzneria viridogrisea TaxID=47990 RepID=A0ABR6C034_9PSEU|nr:hypothetical protein [Kutzneria viridogrisea]
MLIPHPPNTPVDADQVLLDRDLDPENTALQVRGLYRERAHLLAALATHPALHAVLAIDPDPLLPDCATVLYLWLGGQQMSWHLHDLDLPLFGHVAAVEPGDPDIRGQWDGHSTHTKYTHRLRTLVVHGQRTRQEDA